MTFKEDYQGNPEYKDLDAETFSNQLKKDPDAVLIDVRTPIEYFQGHIPGSKLMDIMSPAFPEDIVNLDKTKSYYLYCRSGNRSFHAGKFMIKNGFQKVYNLSSGILGWNEPLVTDKE